MAGNYGPPESQLLATIQKMKNRITALENRSLRIPVLETIPEDGDPVNIWFYNDGRLAIKNEDGLVYEFAPAGRNTIPSLTSSPAASSGIDIWTVASTGVLRVRGDNGAITNYNPVTNTDQSGTRPSTPPPPKKSNPTKKRRVQIWAASWAESYDGDDNRRTDDNHLYYGRYSGTQGRQKSLIGFDYNDIRDTISGATINKVELYLRNLHTYQNSGAYVKIGGHSNSSRPSNYGGAVKYSVSSVRWGKTESDYKTISNWFGTSLRDGSIKGVLLDPRSNSISAYGYAAGVSDSGYLAPRIRITYTK